MQDKHIGFWSFPIFFRVFHRQETIFPHLIKLLLKKHLGKPSSKTLPMGTRRKTSFLTSATAVDTQQISKIQSRLVVKPKIIQSLSPCKNHLINPLNSSNNLWDASDFRVSYELKTLTHFCAYTPNNY